MNARGVRPEVDILGDVRVVSRAPGMAAAYCGKLLVDAGADVVLVEPEGGDPLRARREGGAFAYLNAGKRSITDAGAWIGAADLLITGDAHEAAAARAANPALVVVAITPMGLEGPWADQPTNEFILQAMCGSTGSRGFPDTPPLAAGGGIGDFLCGTFAAVAAMAALYRARRTGEGATIDVSQLESMALSYAYYPTVQDQFKGAKAHFARWIDLPSIEPASDGHVALTTVTPAQFRSFLTLIEREDLADDPEITDRWGRQRARHRFIPIVRGFTSGKPADVLIEAATALRIPTAPVCSAEGARRIDHFRARGLWVDNIDGGFEQAAAPFRIDGARTRHVGPVPGVGSDGGDAPWPARAARTAQGDGALPLAGVKVADCTAFWAGPVASLLLAALGADVIHVEGPDHFDSNRNDSVVPRDQPDWHEQAGLFHAVNTGKRGLAIDLKSPEGQATFRTVLDGCDVLIENNSPRVMDKFGLNWATLHGRNPGLVMTRMPGFGLDGPWRDRVAYAFTAEAVSGLAWSTGWSDAGPTVIGGPCDPLAAAHAAFATILALYRRIDRDGEGALVEVSLIEPALAVSSLAAIDAQIAGIEPGRHGNRDPLAAPQGVYPAAGEDKWIALSVRDDADWEALRGAIGDPDWARDPALATLEGRWAAHDAIDAALGGWLAERDAADTANLLRAAGIAAAEVVRSPDIAANPQMVARGFFEPVTAAGVGTYRLPVMPLRMAGVSQWSHRPAPRLGEHTDDVLAEAGIDAAQVEALRAARVVA
ncbi:MAG: CoA transferase [Sphingobium sp.]